MQLFDFLLFQGLSGTIILLLLLNLVDSVIKKIINENYLKRKLKKKRKDINSIS